MGSVTLEKMGREVGPVSPAITVFFREAFPKRGTWAGGLLILEPHQEVLPTQPGSHQIRGGCNGTHWLLLKKRKRKNRGVHQTLLSDLVLETRSKENRSWPDDELWAGTGQSNVLGFPCQTS